MTPGKVLFWVAVASGPLAVLLWWAATRSPDTVEAVYSRGIYPAVMGAWSRFVGLVPFAVAPLVMVLLVAGSVVLFFLTPKALPLLAAALSVLVACFVLLWGLNYQRLSWADSHGRKAPGGTVADLEKLAGELAGRAAELRKSSWALGDPDWSGPQVRKAVTRAYERMGATDPLLAGHYGDPKVAPVGDPMSWMGIAGIFLPFTGEPLVNPGPNNWQFPFTAAHEAAHLRGFAREDEANFLGFWVLHNDPDPKLAYSAWGSALLYVASALQGAGPSGAQAWARVKAKVDPAVLGDWKAMFAYWDRFRGPVQTATQKVNDLYLKSQGQSDGVKSYGRMVDLLLAWETVP